MGAYDRVTFEGHWTFNKRTVAFIEQVRVIYALLGGTGNVLILQDSYNGGAVEQSGGTHDGGGSIDFGLSVRTAKNWSLLQRACRICGGADWDRPDLWVNGKKVWGHHNHCIVRGDREMSPQAAKQVIDYMADLNGLASHAPDRTWHPSFRPIFRYPLGNVDLSNVRAEARKTRGWVARPGVRHVQRALRDKVGADGIKIDGIYGPKTKAVAARYERQVGGNGDGILGLFSATLLGAAYFNVNA